MAFRCLVKTNRAIKQWDQIFKVINSHRHEIFKQWSQFSDAIKVSVSNEYKIVQKLSPNPIIFYIRARNPQLYIFIICISYYRVSTY